MAAQSERELGAIDMGEGLLDPMAQDEEVEQEMLVVEEEEQFIPPQMGAASAEAAVYDTSPPLPHQNPPPIPAETAQPSTLDMILRALNGMKEEIKNNANEMKEEIKNNTNGMRGEMKELRGGDAEYGCGPAG